MRHENEWKKNKRKFLRASGKEYTRVKGQTIPAKIFTPVNSCFKLDCHKSFSAATQEEIYKKYNLTSFDLQNMFIFSQIKIGPIKRLYSTNNKI